MHVPLHPTERFKMTLKITFFDIGLIPGHNTEQISHRNMSAVHVV